MYFFSYEFYFPFYTLPIIAPDTHKIWIMIRYIWQYYPSFDILQVCWQFTKSIINKRATVLSCSRGMGSVILGNRLYASMRSRNSPKCSKLHISTFNRLMLKSPTIAESEFPSHILAKIGSSSLVNWSMFILLLLSFGGLYIYIYCQVLCLYYEHFLKWKRKGFPISPICFQCL